MNEVSSLSLTGGADVLAASGGLLQQTGHSADVAEAFESIFASLLVKQMRNTGLGEGLFSGDKSDTLGGLFDMFLGQHLAKSQGLGVAKMIQKYVDHAKPL